MVFSPTIVFCPHEEIAKAWHTVEYGLESYPPWGRISGWVGPCPPEFFLKDDDPSLEERERRRVFSHLENFEDAEDLHSALMTRADADVRRLGHEVTDVFRLAIVLKADQKGPQLTDDDLKKFQDSIRNFCRCPGIHSEMSFEVIIVLLQDRALSDKTIGIVEGINSLLTDDSDPQRPPRCHSKGDGATPPKVLFASTWNEKNRPTIMTELEYMCGALLHLFCVQARWNESFLRTDGWVGDKLSPAIIGFRAFFWERVRAVDLSRKKYFKECFGLKWIEEGWVKENSFEELPSVGYSRENNGNAPDIDESPVKWGCLHGQWDRELWRNLNNLKKEDENNIPETTELNQAKESQATNLEEYKDEQKKAVNGKIKGELKRELEEAREKGKPKQRIVRRVLNVISVLAKRHINDKFKQLNDSAAKVKEDFTADFEKYHKDRLREGTGLALLMRHYRRLAAIIEDQSKKYAKEKPTKYNSKAIMSCAHEAVVAQLEKPHERTAFACVVMLFSFLLYIFFNFFEMIKLSDTIISPIMGVGVALVVCYLLAYPNCKGRLKELFSGLGAFLLLLAPLLSYGSYCWLKYYPVGNFTVHIIIGTACALAATLAVLSHHRSTALYDYEKKLELFNDKLEVMVEAMCNHKMVTSIRDVMGHAQELLETEASQLNDHIKEAKDNLDKFYDTPSQYPQAPDSMEFISLLNPKTNRETESTWEDQIKKDTISWAEKFWLDDNDERPEKLDAGEWWYIKLSMLSEKSHRMYLIDQCKVAGGHKLGDEAWVEELWRKMRREKFADLPLQAHIKREDVASLLYMEAASEIWAYHPTGTLGKLVEKRLNDIRETDSKTSIQKFYNPSLVSILLLEHGYSWKAVQQAAIPGGNSGEETE